MPIIAAISDEERISMRKEAQQTRDKNYARRLIAMLMLHQGMTVTEVAKMLCAARSSVGRWINGFTLHGAEGLKSLRPGRAARWPGREILLLHSSTLHRYLKQAEIVWRRVAPTLKQEAQRLSPRHRQTLQEPHVGHPVTRII